MPSREENQNERVRKYLDGLHIDDFMGFCLDCFPDSHRRLSEGMTRTRCVNLLLEEVGAKDVLTELCRRYAKIREQVHNETEQTICNRPTHRIFSPLWTWRRLLPRRRKLWIQRNRSGAVSRSWSSC